MSWIEPKSTTYEIRLCCISRFFPKKPWRIIICEFLLTAVCGNQDKIFLSRWSFAYYIRATYSCSAHCTQRPRCAALPGRTDESLRVKKLTRPSWSTRTSVLVKLRRDDLNFKELGRTKFHLSNYIHTWSSYKVKVCVFSTQTYSCCSSSACPS